MGQAREGVERIAETLLRTGGRKVLLRLPAPAGGGDDAEQLGLAAPTFQDVALAPVVLRDETTLLIAAGSLRALVGSLAFDSVEVLLESAAGVVVDGVLFGIVEIVALQAAGGGYGYRLGLRAPVG